MKKRGRIKKSIALSTILVIVLSLLLVGCNSSTGEVEKAPSDSESAESTGPKQIVMAEAVEWSGLDPYQLGWTGYSMVLCAEGMFTLDQETNELASAALTGYQVSEDGTSITITVPEGLKYATGETVVAEDIKASIEWGLEVSPYASDYAAITSIEVDGNNVILNMDKFSATVAYYLTNKFMPIIDADQIANTSKDDLLMQAVPYAQFSVENFESGSHVSLVRNPYYVTNSENVDNKGASLVDEVTVKFMPDAFSRVTGVKSGEVDIAFTIPAENYDELVATDNIEVMKTKSPGVIYMDMNKDNVHLSDYNVRKAICLALDRESIEQMNGGMVLPAYSLVVEPMFDYDQAISDNFKNDFSNDLEAAKALLVEAGYEDTDGDGILEKDGEKLSLRLFAKTEISHMSSTTQMFQANLKEAGIEVNIELMEVGYIKTRLSEDDYDLVMKDFVWSEPMSILPYLVRDKNNFDAREEFNSLLLETATISDVVERTAKVAEAQEILADELVCIPLLQNINLTAYNKDTVTGIKYLNDGTFSINDMEALSE